MCTPITYAGPMTARRWILLLLFPLMGAFTPLLTAPADAEPTSDPLPVLYEVPDGTLLELSRPDGSAPGSNDWTCRPGTDHPEPVVLVHSSSGNKQINWQTYAPLLANEGYCVYALTYGAPANAPWPISSVGGIESMTSSAQQLSAFVDRVLASTGAQKVDIVGHSQGALMPAYFTKFLGGADKISKYVSLAPMWKGAKVDQWPLPSETEHPALASALESLPPWCQACREMAPNSDFVKALRDGGVYAPGIVYTSIMTRYDTVVVPYTSGYEEAPNATNIVLQDQCPQDHAEHLELMADPVAATYVLNALDPVRPRPVVCESTPFVD